MSNSNKNNGLPRSARNDIMIAMSGGVDSAVTAAICKDKYQLATGATMHLFDDADFRASDTNSPSNSTQHFNKSCCSLADVEDAKAVCNQLGIKHYSFNYKSEFMDKVIMPFARTYERGATPNPCLNCNKYLKFDTLLHRAIETGHTKLATGHYAINRQEADGSYHLFKSVDNTKDQSYVLYFLNQSTLPHLLFPLGEQTKAQTRQQAEKLGLKVADKTDSQDICFVQNRHFSAVLAELIPSSPALQAGDILNSEGNIVGQHQGIANYTIGQRKGLGVASKTPQFVKKINAENNTIILSELAELEIKTVQVKQINEVYPGALSSLLDSDTVHAKFRYNTPAVEAVVQSVDLDQSTMQVQFSKPQVGVAPGQALVIYRDNEVLGGGTIV